MELSSKSFSLIDHAKALVEGLEEGHKQNPTAGLNHAAKNVRFVLGKLQTLEERKKLAEARKTKQGFELKTPVEEIPVVDVQEEVQDKDPETTGENSATNGGNPPAKNPHG